MSRVGTLRDDLLPKTERAQKDQKDQKGQKAKMKLKEGRKQTKDASSVLRRAVGARLTPELTGFIHFPTETQHCASRMRISDVVSDTDMSIP